MIFINQSMIFLGQNIPTFFIIFLIWFHFFPI
jgi:hypothetical protein